MINLSEISTRAPEGLKKSELKKKTAELCEELADLQHIMYAQEKHSLLVVFQGMDASGKDGVTRRVFRRCSPAGIRVQAFKKPTEVEFAHDFLWRIHQHVPQKGMVQVFNRSHYEDVLIQRVHKWISEEHAIARIESINAFEKLLEYDNQTTVLKFYMHLSQSQQKIELRERLDDPKKHWKHKDGDWEESKLWDEYMRCYEDVFQRSTIPWHIVPVDNRWYRDYYVAKTLVEKLKSFSMELPSLKSETFKIG